MFFAEYLVPQIVFVGDSLTQFSANFTNGIVPRLQNEYQRQYDVINRGFSGYNTKWINEVIEPIYDGLSSAPVEYSVIFLGTNDAANNSKQHVDVNDYAVYLESIVDAASLYSNSTILVGPAIVNEDLWPDRSNAEFYEYNVAAKAVAEEAGIPFVDLWTAFHTFFNESSSIPPKFATNNTFNSSVLNNTAAAEALNVTYPVAFDNETASPKFARGSPGLGYIANGNTTLNDTIIAVNTTKYRNSSSTYLGQKGNPKNALLSQVLIDGLHFNNRGYDIFYKALKPFFNGSAPYYPLPDWKNINSTEYLDQYLEKSYLDAELIGSGYTTGNYSWGNYTLTNLTIGNQTLGNVSVSNFTQTILNSTASPTDIIINNGTFITNDAFDDDGFDEDSYGEDDN